MGLLPFFLRNSLRKLPPLSLLIRMILVLSTLLISSCRLQVSAPIGGEVLSGDGQVFCNQEQQCKLDIYDTNFSERFYANTAFGYQFDGWSSKSKHFCGNSLRACVLTTRDFDKTPLLSEILKSHKLFYLSPVFNALDAFQIIGTISTPPVITLDSDVNDPNTDQIHNNDIENAQQIIAPGLIVGYVNSAGYGPNGNTHSTGDNSDYFRVYLSKDQNITMTAGSGVSGKLISSKGEQLKDIGSGPTYVPHSADYYIAIFANNDASNYVINIEPIHNQDTITVFNEWPASIAISDSTPITKVSPSADWLIVEAINVNDENKGEYQLRIAESTENGSYNASINIHSESREQNIDVIGIVSNGSSLTYKGRIYAALYTDKYLRVASGDLNLNAENVEWGFSGVPQGDYHLIFSTDINNDGVLCDFGELCDYYQPRKTIEGFQLRSNLTDIKLIALPNMRQQN